MGSMLQVFCLFTLAIYSVLGCSVCDYNLVTGPYGVADDAINASSTHPHCGTHMARINSTRAWCPGVSEDGQYLQVKFRTISMLKAITTRGRLHVDQWVTEYKVRISMDGLHWTYVLNSTGSAMVFPGNFDRNTSVTNSLEGNITARYIRIYPVAASLYRSMRLEVIGCPFSSDGYYLNSPAHECGRWKATLGSAIDTLPVLLETDISNHGLCGVQCRKQPGCDSFLFDVTSTRCRLLKLAPDRSLDVVNLDGMWYYVKT